MANVQLKVGADKAANLTKAAEWIKKARDEGSQVVALPECFNSLYGTEHFKDYAETIPGGETSAMLSNAAKENEIFLIGGTIPEIDDKSIYNTCTVWNPAGEMIAKYRKIHLFDIDIPGKIRFKESDTLSPGTELATFKVGNAKIGLGICYDLRFEELAKLYRLQHDVDLMVYPGAFNMTTGAIHWELLQRGRAVDNQMYVAAISPARDATAGYVAWGHSQITDPWGKVLTSADETEKIVTADIDISECEKVRQQIPISKQRRTDIYDTVLKQLQTEKVKNQVNEKVEKKADAKTEDEFAKKKSATCAAMKVE